MDLSDCPKEDLDEGPENQKMDFPMTAILKNNMAGFDSWVNLRMNDLDQLLE